MTRLILIRHGETEDNQKGKYCGRTDSPLAERGREQAANLTRIFEAHSVSVIYSSDLTRAIDTAQIIFQDKEIISEPAFSEMDFGLFEGLSYEELIGTYPKEYQSWINDPIKCCAPKGESLQNVAKRVRLRLNDLIDCNNDSLIALVTHGGVIKIILCDAFGYEFNRFWDVNQEHGTISVIDYSSDLSPKVFMNNEAVQVLTEKNTKEREL